MASMAGQGSVRAALVSTLKPWQAVRESPIGLRYGTARGRSLRGIDGLNMVQGELQCLWRG